MHFREPHLNTVSHPLALWNSIYGEKDFEEESDFEEDDNEEKDFEEESDLKRMIMKIRMMRRKVMTTCTVVPKAGGIQAVRRGGRKSRNLYCGWLSNQLEAHQR